MTNTQNSQVSITWKDRTWKNVRLKKIISVVKIFYKWFNFEIMEVLQRWNSKNTTKSCDMFTGGFIVGNINFKLWYKRNVGNL